MNRQYNYFQLSEFLIDPAMRRPEATVPLHVVEKIQSYHIPVLNPIRHELGTPVYVSKYSGFRPVAWEQERGRSGNGQHTFGANQPKGEWNMHWGATDITTKESSFDDLTKHLIDSPYTRICIYPNSNFIHADYKGHWKGDSARGLWIAETKIIENEDGQPKRKTQWIQQDSREFPIQ